MRTDVAWSIRKNYILSFRYLAALFSFIDDLIEIVSNGLRSSGIGFSWTPNWDERDSPRGDS